MSHEPMVMRPTALIMEQNSEYSRKAALKEEVKKGWFRFEMTRMVCVVFIAFASITLKDDTMPTRPLPSHFTQLGELATQRKIKNVTTLLSVPFYVYESLLWHNMTIAGEDLKTMLAERPMKQSEDYWFMQSALIHPMRTLDPEAAQLFVVPALMNYATNGVIMSKGLDPREHGACNRELCNEELIEEVEAILSASPYYERENGKDHIMVLSSWYSSRHHQILESGIFQNLNLIQHENEVLAVNRTTFPSTKVGNPCSLEEEKTNDFAMIASLVKGAALKKRKNATSLKKTQVFKYRQDICDWLRYSRYNTSVCGKGDRCPELAQTRYAFHVQGDRLLDILLSGTIPVFTSDDQYSLLPNWIDWKLLSVQVNATSREDFSSGVDAILNNTNYEEKRDHVLANRGLLDWRTGVAFDVYMFMFQRKLLPETVSESQIVNPYNFSALRIDPARNS